MSLRPAEARWFETYVPREQTVYALDALAATGRVELEADPRLTAPLELGPLRERLQTFERLARPYRDQLPDCSASATTVSVSPELTVSQAIYRLRRWSARFDLLREQLALLERERDNLALLEEWLAGLGAGAGALSRLGHATGFLSKGVYACPRGTDAPAGLDASVSAVIPGPRHDFLVLAGAPEQDRAHAAAAARAGCRRLELPPWLQGSPEEQRARLHARRERVEREIEALEGELAALRCDPSLAQALANVSLLRWYVDNARHVGGGERLCHVTGWTTDADPAVLQQALDAARIRALVRIADPPPGAATPVRMRQRGWQRPFGLLPEMWGTPGRGEVDPSGLLPFVVPLLFGYMFPDLGQGLLIAAVSGLLYRRWPQGRILVPCGLSAALFGLVFGEVFGVEGLIAPLWLHPLQAPVQVLLLPLGFGVVLVLLGLVFTAAEARWGARLGRWMATEAAVLVLYLTVLAGVFVREALLAVPAALLWYAVGSLWSAPRGARLAGLGLGLARLLHQSFELGMNTLSFARVGAFALAHAGLAAAVWTLAEGTGSALAFALVLVLGNAFSIFIEGLVVFVQTTRLVLFEFFLRFLRAEGRVFRPVGRASPR